MSLATIYNTLNQFTTAGLLREIALQGSRTWYDTNTGPHYHFLIENRDDLLDIPAEAVGVLGLPEPPEGLEIVGADLIVRVRKIDPATSTNGSAAPRNTQSSLVIRGSDNGTSGLPLAPPSATLGSPA
jgi:Ferric uptake regulator family